MAALVVSLLAALAVGVSAWIPAALDRDSGMANVVPGRLSVDKAASGVATLGEGYTVSLNQSGFRYALGDLVLLDTVTGGSPLVAVRGETRTGDGERIEERVRTVLSNAHFTGLEVNREEAVWTGVLTSSPAGGTGEIPFQWRVRRLEKTVLTTITVAGSEAIVVPLDRRPATTGLAPALPDRNLRLKSWWVASGEGVLGSFTTVLGTAIGVGPGGAQRGLDLRWDGRTDIHVWSDVVEVRLSGEPRPPSRS